MSLQTIKVKKVSDDNDKAIFSYKPYDSEGIIIFDRINKKIWIEKCSKEDEGGEPIYGNKVKMYIALKYEEETLADEFLIH